MAQTYLPRITSPHREAERPFIWWIDVLVALVVVAMAAGVVALAAHWSAPLTPKVEIDLSWRALPVYAGYSTLRMALAYLLSAVFSVAFARLAARSRTAERIMIPILDILQSIPILSFMPGIVLGLVALFPHRNLGLELAAVILIFTSQAWNLAFGLHQSLTTIPKELDEAATSYHLSFWDRLTRLELPFGMIPFIWNSMMSWAGGWFFLVASEQFTLGRSDFQLPGLGSYLKTAADANDIGALFRGLGTLVLVIVLLDIFLWRPLVAWSDRFKFEQSESTDVADSPILMALRRSAILEWVSTWIVSPIGSRLDRSLRQISRPKAASITNDRAMPSDSHGGRRAIGLIVILALAAAVVLGGLEAAGLLVNVGPSDWQAIGIGTLATLIRTSVALAVGALWTVPVGVAIGMNPRWARRVQPIVQIIASIPATAIFPALLLVLLGLPGGLSLAAVALMLLGTQWYILFNVIAGAMAIPTDLREAAAVYKLAGWQRWRRLIFPAIFPFLVTGLITATGGAWNASIVSEYVTFGGNTVGTVGLGSLIAGAAADANFPVLFAGTLTMALVVVMINRLLWRRLYSVAQQRFRLE